MDHLKKGEVKYVPDALVYEGLQAHVVPLSLGTSM